MFCIHHQSNALKRGQDLRLLPVFQSIELGSGPGMSRLAKHLTDEIMAPPEIAAKRNGEMAKVWKIWCALAADLLHTLTMTADPDIIVLGGGLSQIEGIADDLTQAMKCAQLSDFSSPQLVLAQGGDASGARGAAYAAWQEALDG